jgi:hypothetical protein
MTDQATCECRGKVCFMTCKCGCHKWPQRAWEDKSDTTAKAREIADEVWEHLHKELFIQLLEAERKAGWAECYKMYFENEPLKQARQAALEEAVKVCHDKETVTRKDEESEFNGFESAIYYLADRIRRLGEKR